MLTAWRAEGLAATLEWFPASAAAAGRTLGGAALQRRFLPAAHLLLLAALSITIACSWARPAACKPRFRELAGGERAAGPPGGPRACGQPCGLRKRQCAIRGGCPPSLPLGQGKGSGGARPAPA